MIGRASKRRRGAWKSKAGRPSAQSAPKVAPAQSASTVRAGRSHVMSDGTPKPVMSAAEATMAARSLGLNAYLCSQGPEHYHVGGGR